MAKEPANVFLKNVPKGQLPDNITVDTGEDLIEAVKYYLNKDRYSYLKRGGKPVDKKDWVKHSYGIPVSKSKTLRLYIYDEPKDKKIRDLESKVWKLEKKVADYSIQSEDLKRTVVKQRQEIFKLDKRIWNMSPHEHAYEPVEYHEFRIEIFATEGYSSSGKPPWVGYNKTYYKIWNMEKDKYEDTYHMTFTTYRKALAHAKEAIMSTRGNVVKTVEYHEYEIEVFCNDKYVTLDIPSKYGYKIWDCEKDKYVYGNYKLHSIDGAIADAKAVIEETREEKYYG